MAKKFKELGEKAEVLIEQGKEVDQNIQGFQSRVTTCNRRVVRARRQLATASEIDEEGKPLGDVESLQFQLWLEENQLAASQQILFAAVEDAQRVSQEKNVHVNKIEKYNQVEQSNLEKLRKLRAGVFGSDTMSITEGIAKRLNEAEDIKAELLLSMGIETSPNKVDVSGAETFDLGWHGGGFAASDIDGQALNYQGGNSEGYSSSGIPAPVGGGLPSVLNPFDSNEIAKENPNSQKEDLSLIKTDESFDRNVFAEDEHLLDSYNTLVNRIFETKGLSNEEKISELNILKLQLKEATQVYINQAEVSGVKKYIKVLKLSPAERRKNGKRYIDNILEMYKDEIYERGVTSIIAVDSMMVKLKQHYILELEKDIMGQTNRLYVDPNYDELVNRIKKSKPPIANVSPGEIMSFKDANSGHVNPNCEENIAYKHNCQSCVVVFEARQRGYNVQVLPYTRDSMLEKLSQNTKIAWIAPKTRTHPQYIFDDSLRTPHEYLNFINNTIKKGNRYTIQFSWKRRAKSGHIVNIDRTDNGQLRIKDNQRSFDEISEYIGDKMILEYLSKMKYEDKPVLGKTRPCVPQLLRVDNMDFDFSVVNYIMKGAENGAIIS